MGYESPYHSGEIEIQKKVGEFELGTRNGRVIKDEILKGALNFINQQRYCFVTSQDENEDIWISYLFGDKEFAQASEKEIVFDLEKLKSYKYDIFWKNVLSYKRIGTLFIEFDSRRRIRVNGGLTDNKLLVEESYPNCPKYIQRRIFAYQKFIREPQSIYSKGLTEEHRELIQSADNFYVGSGHYEKGLDSSHRGGKPGFVSFLGDNTLLIPDYAGNSMFNTMGNLILNPRAGLILIDFENNKTLQLTGKGKVLLDYKLENDLSGGTHRYWQFEVEKVIETDLGCVINWEYLDASPFNP